MLALIVVLLVLGYLINGVLCCRLLYRRDAQFRQLIDDEIGLAGMFTLFWPVLVMLLLLFALSAGIGKILRALGQLSVP